MSIITSPEVSTEKGYAITGNYYLSILVKDGKTTISFPLCKQSSLFCFEIEGLIENLSLNGWIDNFKENFIIVPPDRKGFFVYGKRSINVNRIYSKIFWEMEMKVKSMMTNWSKIPVFYSSYGSFFPSISFYEHEDGYFVSVGDTPESAVLNNISMARDGVEKIRNETQKFFKKFQKLDKFTRDNALMAIFYSNGKCIDTEDDCILASKSPKYYVSGGFWARDFLFWTFPVIEKFDVERAKHLLYVILKKYWKNKGIHALYLDGRILYPGFELDELSYYFYLLERSFHYGIIDVKTADSLGKEILSLLKRYKSEKFHLYRTELNSSDDPVKYPYVTYSNVVLWYFIKVFGNSLKDERYIKLAESIKKDIMKKMIHNNMFCYSTDLKGKYEFYDDPTGSLILLPYFGFIDFNSEVYRNTVDWIKTKNPYMVNGEYKGCGNRHVNHPWLFYYSSLLLTDQLDKSFIKNLPLDKGLSCETIDENTGECLTGLHFPGSAGFIVQALLKKSDL